MRQASSRRASPRSHRPSIAVCRRRSLAGSIGLAARTKLQTQRHAREIEVPPDDVLQEPLVMRLHEIRIVAVEEKAWRMRGDLRSVEDAQDFAGGNRGWMCE